MAYLLCIDDVEPILRHLITSTSCHLIHVVCRYCLHKICIRVTWRGYYILCNT